MKNKPYVKQYDVNGVVMNPINGIYESSIFATRKQRRYKEPRFIGNGKNYHLTVQPLIRFKRIVQIVKDSSVKGFITIYHYQAVKQY